MAGPEDLAVERRRLRGKYDVDPIFYKVNPADRHLNLGEVVSFLCRLQDEHDYSSLLPPESRVTAANSERPAGEKPSP